QSFSLPKFAVKLNIFISNYLKTTNIQYFRLIYGYSENLMKSLKDNKNIKNVIRYDIKGGFIK
ncbi:hypothetical protein, partial [Elizabethkingia anophelis]|uniref:hypothetical protein n=1 Tax=Elizabethkingia anophelis TaxID=1117645 RepID=UPI003209E459